MTVLIAGGGISGLTLALTCHQVGIPCTVFESNREMKPLGVGINLQPSAVRELYALGFEDRLGEIGVKTRDYGFYTKRGLHIWTEPRGLGRLIRVETRGLLSDEWKDEIHPNRKGAILVAAEFEKALKKEGIL